MLESDVLRKLATKKLVAFAKILNHAHYHQAKKFLNVLCLKDRKFFFFGAHTDLNPTLWALLVLVCFNFVL